MVRSSMKMCAMIFTAIDICHRTIFTHDVNGHTYNWSKFVTRLRILTSPWQQAWATHLSDLQILLLSFWALHHIWSNLTLDCTKNIACSLSSPVNLTTPTRPSLGSGARTFSALTPWTYPEYTGSCCHMSAGLYQHLQDSKRALRICQVAHKL